MQGMCKIRSEITKGEEIRYISHLDYASAVERAIRRTNLPVSYSEGFNPHMKISFASALAVGVTSDAEYMDVEFKEPIYVKGFCETMRNQLPPGIELLRAVEIVDKQPALMAIVNSAVYQVCLPYDCDFSKIKNAVKSYNEAEMMMFTRFSPKKGKKEIEIKQYMERPICVTSKGTTAILDMYVKITPMGSIKPGEVLQAIAEKFDFPIYLEDVLIHRKGIYVNGSTPIDLLINEK